MFLLLAPSGCGRSGAGGENDLRSSPINTFRTVKLAKSVLYPVNTHEQDDRPGDAGVLAVFGSLGSAWVPPSLKSQPHRDSEVLLSPKASVIGRIAPFARAATTPEPAMEMPYPRRAGQMRNHPRAARPCSI